MHVQAPEGTLARGIRAVLGLCLISLLAGCTTPPLESARANYYAGRFAPADQNLAAIPADDKDEVLYLMERGMIRYSLADYENSARDWRAAAEQAERLETYSVSQGAASMIVNDRMLSFRGMPFERTLLYAFLAKDYWAMTNWDFAAICGRNIIKQLENLDGFPDVPYGRYLAGVTMEMINDEGNAAIQYKAAARQLPRLIIDEDSGQFGPANAWPPPPKTQNLPGELICFVAIGRATAGLDAAAPAPETDAPYAEIFVETNCLGRTYAFANTDDLMRRTRQRLATIQLAKDAARIGAKIAIAESVKSQNDTLGALAYLILFAMETPDTRRWETLPLWLEIARVPCPAQLTGYTIHVKNASGATLATRTITAPILRRGNLFISFCRDVGE